MPPVTIWQQYCVLHLMNRSSIWTLKRSPARPDRKHSTRKACVGECPYQVAFWLFHFKKGGEWNFGLLAALLFYKVARHHLIVQTQEDQTHAAQRGTLLILLKPPTKKNPPFLHRPFPHRCCAHQRRAAAMAMAYKMATQGMNIKDECKSWFTEMKWKKVHRFVVYKIDERSRAVLVDKVGGPGEGYEELVAALPKDDCRYAVFDFDFVSVDNCQKSKIFFIAWSPAASRIRAKILYATSKQGLRRVLDGVHYEVQATDPSEMGFDVIRERAQ